MSENALLGRMRDSELSNKGSSIAPRAITAKPFVKEKEAEGAK